MKLFTTENKQQRSFLLTVIVAFIAAFSYILVRAYVTEPLHDEVATLFHYVQNGILLGPESVIDANNHLLNSFLGKIIYRFSGPHFFWLRIPNVLAFIPYFIGVFLILKRLKRQSLQYIGLFLCVFIPYYFDYFSAFRGYGLALGGLLLSIATLLNYIQSNQTKQLIYSLLLLAIAIYANLTLIIVGILYVLYFLVYFFIHQQLSQKSKIILTICLLLFIVAIFPAFQFSNTLRKAGALYYGGKEGLWINTGKDLMYCTLKFSPDWLKWFLLMIIIAAITGLVRKLANTKLIDFLKSPAFFNAYLFLGILISAIAMVLILNVNYPSDRTAMHLIVLFYLWLIFMLDEIQWMKYVHFILLLIPIYSLSFYSLHTSIYTPGERMSKTFFKKVKMYAKSNKFVTIYETQALNWAYFDREEPEKTSVIYNKEFNPYVDIIINKLDYKDFNQVPKGFYEIATDPVAKHVAYQRNRPFKSLKIGDTTIHLPKGNYEFIELKSLPITTQTSKEILYFKVTGIINSTNPKRTVQLIFKTEDENGQMVRYNFWDERFSQGQAKKLTINYNHTFGELLPQEKSIKIYIWNPLYEEIDVKNIKFEWFKLEQ